jgi:hypothetical protein
MPVSELAEDLRDSLVSLGDSGEAVRGAAAAVRADLDSIEASASGVDSGARQQAAAAIAAFEAALGDLDARVRAGEGAAAVSGAANDAVDRLVDLADLVRSRVGEGPASGAVDRALAGFRRCPPGSLRPGRVGVRRHHGGEGTGARRMGRHRGAVGRDG